MLALICSLIAARRDEEARLASTETDSSRTFITVLAQNNETVEQNAGILIEI